MKGFKGVKGVIVLEVLILCFGFKMISSSLVVLYNVFVVFSLPQALVKTLAKNLVKNLAKNLVKHLAPNCPKTVRKAG